MANWFRRQYDDIKGNMKWALLAILWAPLSALAKKLLHMIPDMPDWAVWLILFVLSAIAFVWLAKSSRRPSVALQQAPSQSSTPPLIPTISGLYGQTPQITFDPVDWFKHAYYSPVTAEVENNMKIVAQKSFPNDREGFYARLIGIGIVSYLHDMTWAYIFKSQILMLMEMNRKNGWLSVSEAKVFYDNAVASCPKVYAKYSFGGWLEYMKGQQLLVRHPSEMLEITHRGKDFLKYVAHWGRDLHFKTC